MHLTRARSAQPRDAGDSVLCAPCRLIRAERDPHLSQRLPFLVVRPASRPHAAGLRSGIPPGHLIKGYVSYLIRVTGLITHPATPLHGKGSNLGLD